MRKNISYSVIRTPFTSSRFLLLLFLAGFSLSGWLRVSQALINQSWIEVLRLTPGTWYFVFSGAAWGGLFLAAFAAVLFQSWWAGRYTIAAAVLFSIWRWIERLVFTQSPLVNTGWIFEVLLNAAVIIVLLLMLTGFPPTTPVE